MDKRRLGLLAVAAALAAGISLAGRRLAGRQDATDRGADGDVPPHAGHNGVVV